MGIPWLFLMLFTSGSFTEIKAALMILLLIVSIFEIIFNRLPVHSKQSRYVFFFICYFILSIFIGEINGYPFSLKSDFSLIYYYAITPISIIIFSTIFNNDSRRRMFLWQLIIVLTFLLTLLDLAKVSLFAIGISPSFLDFIKMNSEDLVTSLHLRVNNETSLMFLLPIFLYLSFNPDTNNLKLRYVYVAISILGVLYTVLSGRKILELLLVFTTIIALIVRIKTNPNVKFMRRLLLVSLSLLLIAPFLSNYFSSLLGIDDVFSLAYESFVKGISSGSDGVGKRMGNTDALLTMFYESPVWGNGVQSYAVNSLASDESKWSYEVVYIAWLAQTGLVGSFLLAIPMIYIVKRLKKTYNQASCNRYVGIMYGFICFIICGATNPLVYFVWPWTISLIYGNENKKRSYSQICKTSKHV